MVALNKEIKFKDISSSCEEKADKGSFETAGLHHYIIVLKSGLNLRCSVGAAFLKSSMTLSQDVVEDSLHCTLPDDTCYADSGNVYPAACVFPFIHEGREFHACTDVN